MQNFDELFKDYTIKHDRIIKKICNPIKDYLGISIFTYYYIDENGYFGVISNNAYGLEFFFKEKVYLSHPYIKHPRLLQSGCALMPSTLNKNEFLQTKLQIGDLFYVLQNYGQNIEGFGIGIPWGDPRSCSNYFLNNLFLIQKFIPYFKREALYLIEDMKREGYNLLNQKGALFLESENAWPLSSKDQKVQHFLKTISPLSKREQQCLNLYKQGHSSQATAAILNLSQRTVEYYFENIKNKLNCSSKRDLLQF